MGFTNEKINMIELQLHMLENYMFAIRSEQGNKEAYCKNIMHWYQVNRKIIDSPIMREYWTNKIKSSKKN